MCKNHAGIFWYSADRLLMKKLFLALQIECKQEAYFFEQTIPILIPIFSLEHSLAPNQITRPGQERNKDSIDIVKIWEWGWGLLVFLGVCGAPKVKCWTFLLFPTLF